MTKKAKYSYYPTSKQHHATLYLEDQNTDNYFKHETVRELTYYLGSIGIGAASYGFYQFLVNNMSYKFLGKLGIAINLSILSYQIFKNEVILVVNDKLYSLTGFDPLGSITRNINHLIGKDDDSEAEYFNVENAEREPEVNNIEGVQIEDDLVL